MSIDHEMEEILQVFFEETAEGLGAMESGLLSLDSNADPETINTIFRAAHSIKGGAGTFGFLEVSVFTHDVETLLDEMRKGTRAVCPETIQLLLEAVDVIRQMTDAAATKQDIPVVDAQALTRKLQTLLASAHRPDSAAIPTADSRSHTPPPGVGGWRIDFQPDSSLFKTCNDPLRIFEELERLGKVTVLAGTSHVPSITELTPSCCYLSWTLSVEGDIPRSRIEEAFDWVDANSRISIESLTNPAPPDPVPGDIGPDTRTATVPTPPIDGPDREIPVPMPTPSIPEPRMTPKPDDSAPRPDASATARPSTESASIRVGTEKVDALINLVGELVITQSMLNRFIDQFDMGDLAALRRGLTHLSRNTRELQESVLKIRMLPISFTFSRFPRLVHELSRKLGKKVELRMSGDQTELDKTVLERIADPLVHLVRNSLDHGLETPAQRAAAGKAEVGVLELNAFHEGGSIIVEVKDDGAGINKERVIARARERGLLTDEPLSEEQIFQLIFMPGFSTADTVSEVSGRGVGMDVVRRNIGDIGGHVQVTSVEGRGTTIRIRLPLTLAILEGQMLRIGSETYVISLLSIIETVQPRSEQIHTVAGRSELLRHRGNYLPIVRLHRMFGIETQGDDLQRGLLVVVEADGQRAALLVDELLAQQQVVIKSLDTNFKHVPGLAGATIHGDGRVALIIDVAGVLRLALRKDGRGVGLAA